ncbi:penicillin-binding transpeptidase domain-containing protein [Actinocorallia sp. B10E7]|uniref:penicillin-binding transpeptidase domain-containing protein n=1 Tax=Actinocorallia sp. B10E7 TaxID=3153558 RepID=UPI00325D932B
MTKMSMNDQLKRVALVGLALIAILMINANYIQAFQAKDLQNHALNNRKSQGIFLRFRGDIYSSDKMKLAFSEPLSPGNSKTKYQRKYLKNAEVFVPITGYFSSTLSKGGVELSFDSILDGRDERQTATSWVRTLAGEKPLGGNVYTTVDAKAQQVAYQRLTAQGPIRAAAVVIEAETGAVKVAAGFPSFDPNTIASIQKLNEVAANLNKLTADKDQPLVNKAYSELFPPGSSFKTVVAAAFLSQNGNTKDTPVPAPSQVPTGGSKPITNSHDDGINCGLPQAPLINTFAESCNTTYALLGADDQYLGNNAVRLQAEKFGFYSKIPIEDDLSAPASEYPHNAQNRDEILRGSFGQGETKTSPLQMAMVAAAIANDGNMMKPYLVDKAVARVEGDGGKPEEAGTIYEADPSSMGKPLSGDSAGQLQDMMRQVVATGTAKNLQGRNIAGKTGTTELTATRGGAWFVGFAPADKPKYGFAVFVEGSTSIFGATAAGPIAADIIDALSKK